MKIKIYLVFSLLSFFTALPLAAQSSWIADTTFGFFRNDTDLFMDPNDYGSVEFENFFSCIQYSPDFQQTYDSVSAPKPLPFMGDDTLSAGCAGYFGNVYVGGFFQGNLYERFWSGLTPKGSAYTVYDTLSVLIGAESIGGIVATAGYQYRDETIGGVSGSTGGVTLGGGWGKNFALDNGFLLKPQIGFIYSRAGMNLPQDMLAAILVLGSGNTDIDYFVLGSAEVDLELPENENVLPVIYAKYTFLYVKMPFSSVINRLSCSYKRVYDVTDRFSAGFGIGLDFSFSTGKKNTGVSTTIITGLLLVPSGQAGFTYKFNGPFSVYAGVKVDYGLSYGSIKTPGSDFSFTVHAGDFEVFTGTGGSFQPNKNLAIDFSYGIGYYSTDTGRFTLGVRFKK